MDGTGTPDPTGSMSSEPAGLGRGWPKVFAAALVAALLFAYPFLLHELIASDRWPALTVLAGLLPAALLAAAALARSPHHVVGLTALLMAALLAWHKREALQGSAEWIYLVQHLAMQLFLCWLFGHTLLAGRQALVARLATRVRGTLSPELLGYTRRVTWAWAVFFALDAAVSLLLFVFSPLAVWSFFANVLTMPLVALMFVAEYAVRRTVLSHLPHVSLARSVQAFWDDRSGDPGRCP